MANYQSTHLCPFVKDECKCECALALINKFDDSWACSFAIMGQRTNFKNYEHNEEGPLYEAQEVNVV